MNEVLESFRLALRDNRHVVVNDMHERQRLIGEGKIIAEELRGYGEKYPKVLYLTATRIEFDMSGLYASRNVNLDKVPNSSISELVEAGKDRLNALDEQFEVVKREFSTDIAAICFSKPEVVANRREIMRELYKRKINELEKLCMEKVTFPSKSDAALDARITINANDLQVHFESSTYSTPTVSVHSYSGRMSFLKNYNAAKAKTIDALTQIFKSKEEPE